MSKIQKLLEKFQVSPQNIKLAELEKILEFFHFEKVDGKGSHILFKRGEIIVTIPEHGGDCKDFYKHKALKVLQKLNLL